MKSWVWIIVLIIFACAILTQIVYWVLPSDLVKTWQSGEPHQPLDLLNEKENFVNPLDVPVWVFGGSGIDSSYDSGGVLVNQPRNGTSSLLHLADGAPNPEIALPVETGGGIDSNACRYIADSGYVCPVLGSGSAASNEILNIIPFSQASASVQNQVHKSITSEWNSDDIENGVMLFVALSHERFLGCVAVDTNDHVPSISHLYVICAKRREGYGRRLLAFAERYLKSLGFAEARLRCDPALVGYFRTLGWSGGSQMIKTFT